MLSKVACDQENSKKPKTLEEIRDKATGQIEIEELRETRRSEKLPSRKDDDKPNRSIIKDNRKSFKLTPRFDSYTRFNARREDIINDILHNRLIKPPVKAGTYQDQKYVDKEKHCAFHQKFGHTTDECVVAKDLLERLERQGLLDKYIGSRSQKETVDTRGFAGGGMTNAARKRSYRAMMAMEKTQQDCSVPNSPANIRFSTSDLKSRVPKLDDPMVISVNMGEMTMKKVLLDPESSADVLFYSTFKKMQPRDKSLQPSGGELAGFSGERVPISGYIWLRTTLGEPPNSKTLDIQFLVVDCASPYNVIFGRPSLNSFGAIVSTIHLCIKFLLQDDRIATVHADRREARQCYNASLKITKEGIPRINSVYNSEHTPQLAEMETTTATLHQQTI
ncbi:uncharacterized protein LOC107464735 [Arachis duranensis]|uniref:Uncharacterized protein LOC107464735 n=1 Tax=Arachis duranensis TaxID=130453 RepID=A0A9C6T581_ARADU|nr:uncharacterized protein LOC107464735 [Arachis duranensis]